MTGLQNTLVMSALTLSLAMVGGLVIAMLDMSKFWPTRSLGVAFGEIIRNTPILVQLLWVYYVLPMVDGINLPAFTALVVGLSLYSSSFLAVSFLDGIQTTPVGPRELAPVLGLLPVH